jgi:phytoene desaturase
MSLFLIYFGTNRQYPELAHHNILFGKSYRGLLSQIFTKAKKIPDDFSLYLHAPTRTDPGMAPEGCEAFYVLSPVPHLGNLDVDWKKEGPAYADRILNYIEQHYAPGLRQHIVTQKIFTPMDFKVELNSHLGSAFSSEPVLWQSAFFRTHNRDDRVAGMYFTGAGTHPGAGVPGVVNSAKATASLVLEDLKADLPIRDREPGAMHDLLSTN